jgi:hypothetical protein
MKAHCDTTSPHAAARLLLGLHQQPGTHLRHYTASAHAAAMLQSMAHSCPLWHSSRQVRAAWPVAGLLHAELLLSNGGLHDTLVSEAIL